MMSTSRGGGSPSARSSQGGSWLQRGVSAVAARVGSSGLPIRSRMRLHVGASGAAFVQQPSAQQDPCPPSGVSRDCPLSSGCMQQPAEQQLGAAAGDSSRHSAKMRFSQQHSDIHAARARTSRRWKTRSEITSPEIVASRSLRCKREGDGAAKIPRAPRRYRHLPSESPPASPSWSRAVGAGDTRMQARLRPAPHRASRQSPRERQASAERVRRRAARRRSR